MEQTDKFWRATTEELKRGYFEDTSSDTYTCLVCGAEFEKGIVYPQDGRLYEAERYTRLHVHNEHGSTLHWLLEMDKRLTGLTELQRRIIALFADGRSDEEMVRELGGGSKSTIRNHRFTLREKMKQAKVFLTIMELAEEQAANPHRLVSIHRTATMVDERYAVTEQENESILRTYFKQGPDGPLAGFPTKEKRKIVILRQLIRRFQADRSYSEKEINEILKQAFDDYVTLRRYLIEYGFMDREPDGSRYWVKEAPAAQRQQPENKEETKMDHRRRKELVDTYMQNLPPMGVYQIKNTVNGKVFIGSSVNLDGAVNRDQFMLKFGNHANRELQQDWNEAGEGAFTFEYIDVIKPKEGEERGDRETIRKYQEEVKLLEKMWLDKLQPYGERGYNKPQHLE